MPLGGVALKSSMRLRCLPVSANPGVFSACFFGFEPGKVRFHCWRRPRQFLLHRERSQLGWLPGTNQGRHRSIIGLGYIANTVVGRMLFGELQVSATQQFLSWPTRYSVIARQAPLELRLVWRLFVSKGLRQNGGGG